MLMLLKNMIASPNRAIQISLLCLTFGLPTIGYAATAIVTGNVNVREGAATKYRKIATLRPGWQVDAGPCQAGWCHIRVGNVFGWISARYLSFTQGGHFGQPSPHYRQQPTVIIESGPIFRRQPYWGWDDDWGYRPIRPPYRPRPLPPVPPAPPGPPPYQPHYDPYGPSPFSGPGPVYPPMRNVPIGKGVTPGGAGIGQGVTP
jgi:uncharacterized protein YraI